MTLGFFSNEFTLKHRIWLNMFFAPQCVYFSASWGRLLAACYVVLKYTAQAGDGCWSHVTEGWGLYLDDIISSRVDFEGLLSYRHRVGAIVYAARLVLFYILFPTLEENVSFALWRWRLVARQIFALRGFWRLLSNLICWKNQILSIKERVCSDTDTLLYQDYIR